MNVVGETTTVVDRSARGAAWKIVAVYWALLVFGMVLYTALRMDAIRVLAPMWAGTIGGSALGQLLAARRYRVWLAVLIILAVATFVLPHAPPELGGKRLWLAFLPASICGYWSLGDRTSLIAFWFPAVIWMLSILDGTHAGSMPSGNGLVLFAGLAVLFVVFLRVREERRVALWRTVGPEPLATPRPRQIIKERANVQLARAAWGVLVTGLGFAATAWIAPSLWKPETHEGKHVQVAAETGHIGLPCCPATADDEPVHTRVKEYFDVGRADTEHHVAKPQDCRVCTEEVPSQIVDNSDVYVAGGGGGYIAQGGGSYTAPTYTPPSYDYTENPTGSYTVRSGSYTPPANMPAENDPWGGELNTPSAPTPAPTPSTTTAPTTQTPGTTQAPSGMSITTDVPSQPPTYTPTTRYSENYEHPRDTAVPQVADEHRTLTPERPHLSANTTPVEHHDQAGVPVRPESGGGLHLLHWIAVIAASLFFVQVVSLMLRPLRRAVVLRHLRRPFWTETVDQRVSNAWQLVLVGLRDAGWRSDGGESPRELAKRVGVDGVEECASILDRARHGIRIDREDLDKMVASADVAYRGARDKVGRVSRTVSCLRWPLV